MRKAIREPTAKAATIGTRRMAGLPNTPPKTSESTVVGSKVAAEILIDEEDAEKSGIIFKEENACGAE